MDGNSRRRERTSKVSKDEQGSCVFPPDPSSFADNSEIDEYDSSPTAQATPVTSRRPEEREDNSPADLLDQDGGRYSAASDQEQSMQRCITSFRSRHHSEGDHEAAALRATFTKRRSISKSYSTERDAPEVYGFVQLDVLLGEDAKEWREIARWIKYEEDLEEGADRLGKPHISPLSFHYLVKLSHLIERNSVLLLDLVETDITGISARITERLLSQGIIDAREGGCLLKDLLLQHRRVEETGTDRSTNWFWFGGKFAPDGLCTTEMQSPSPVYQQQPINAIEVRPPFLERRRSMVPRRVLRLLSFSSSPLKPAARYGSAPDNCAPGVEINAENETLQASQRHDSFPVGVEAEATMIMVRGEHRHKKGALVLVRLQEAALLGEVTQFPMGTRFLIVLLAPCGKEPDFVELGRSMGTLMSNRKFYETALSSTSASDLVLGINNFLDETLVLPPGDWYNSNFYDLFPIHVLQTKAELIKLKNAKHLQRLGLKAGETEVKAILGAQDAADVTIECNIGHVSEIPGPFVYTGRPFGGLINDIRRRYPLYWSDITMGFNLQTVAACIFLYFASIAHNITFGGIMNDKTDGAIGVTETLMAASLSGMIFAALSGQPLLVIAPTGPLLVFDEILFKFMVRNNIEFLPARAWISVWVLVICLVVVFFEGSRFVKLFTRFTQETFACLISIIFVVESFENLAETFHEHPLIPDHYNFSDSSHPMADPHSDAKNEPNTALLCTFLMLGTFYIAISLKHFRTSVLLGSKVRNVLGDFAVPISIFLMVALDWWAGEVYTVKIKVPPGLQPTSPTERGWFINPFGIKKPFNPWVPVLALMPGVLVFILVYMTAEICELILMKKPKVDKGCGFHLDALILSLVNIGSGFFGTPWLSCATLKVLAHLAALTVYSSNDPPGQEPRIVMVLEQRVSAFVMSVFLGLSILMAPALEHVSMAVLFGVFLYMGISSLHGNQLWDRICLFLVPPASYPQVEYVRRVPTWKIHMYTLIQLGLLAMLWGVKSIKEIALTFPFVLMLLVPIRLNLRRIYTENELDALDGDPKPGAPAAPPPAMTTEDAMS